MPTIQTLVSVEKRLINPLSHLHAPRRLDSSPISSDGTYTNQPRSVGTVGSPKHLISGPSEPHRFTPHRTHLHRLQQTDQMFQIERVGEGDCMQPHVPSGPAVVPRHRIRSIASPAWQSCIFSAAQRQICLYRENNCLQAALRDGINIALHAVTPGVLPTCSDMPTPVHLYIINCDIKPPRHTTPPFFPRMSPPGSGPHLKAR